MKMRTVKFSSIIVIAWFSSLMFLNTAIAQDVKGPLFKDATTAMEMAKKVRADVLAPKSYAEAMDDYQRAEDDFNRGKNLEEIRKRLRSAVAAFNKAGEATRLADVTFVSSIKARADADNAEAGKYATAGWNKAEEKFAEAAGRLEDGNVKDAQRKAGEAEALYRQAELDAIKANYFQETWSLLERADKLKVKDRAPKTLQKAKTLIADAEKELNNNRYDTDVARGLAQQAKYEAKHALYLNSLFESMKKNKTSDEDLVLNSEIPLQRIAATMDVVAEFDGGYDAAANAIMTNIQSYQDQVAELTQTVKDRDELVAGMEGRVTELEGKLGKYEEEQSELKGRMMAQAKVREKFKQVEGMFSREEARVFREGDNVIIRLVGLNFSSGKSVIEPNYFSLLTKVQNAINTFPGGAIEIEGHTDSYGGDALNLKLSEERSAAVRQYLLANLRSLTPEKIIATGYGESQPIANNETAEGRTKNRRIDIVIRPELESMAADTKTN